MASEKCLFSSGNNPCFYWQISFVTPLIKITSLCHLSKTEELAQIYEPCLAWVSGSVMCLASHWHTNHSVHDHAQW